MRILVLGGNGFIGSHVTDALLAAGHEVNVFDRNPEVFRSPLARVNYFLGEFSDPFLLAEALQDVELVMHLISTTVPSTSNLDPIADINGNLVNTVRLLQLMLASQVKRIVYLSSGGTVYGTPAVTPVPETHVANPICSYGVVKVAVEKYLGVYAHNHGLQVTIIRPSNPYGPRQGHKNVQGVIPTFMSRVMQGEKIQIWGDGSVKRDYFYISDLARLCLLAAESEHSGVFNAGSGHATSLNDLLGMIEQVTGLPARVEYLEPRKFDVQEIALNIERAAHTFNWQPEISLSQGIAAHYAWLSQILDEQ